MNRTVIVSGGMGVIGKAIVAKLKDQGYENVLIDDPICMSKTLQGRLEEITPCTLVGYINAAYPKMWEEHQKCFIDNTRLVSSFMKDYDIKGAIVNLASIYGPLAPDYRVYEGTEMHRPFTYNFIKNGIIGFSKCMAVEYAEYGIRVNCISPGGVEDGQPETFTKKYCDRVPMGRMAEPEDIAGVAAFLIGRDSRYITGQNIMVDGGLSAW